MFLRHLQDAVICTLLLMFSCGASGQASSAFLQKEVDISPLAGEDIESPCHYAMKVPQAQRHIRGVWLIFDRGRDVHDLFADTAVLRFARQSGLAVVLQGFCPGKNLEDRADMNMEPSAGLGPSLLRALDQFAIMTGHPELRSASLILLGFSGAGPLAARFIAEYPKRVLAGVLSAPGHFAPQGIDNVDLDRDAQNVPELIIVGGADDRAGTQLPYQYFVKYRKSGAPWTFVVQNRTPHCCTANAKTLVLDWLSAVLEERLPRRGGQPASSNGSKPGWLGSIRTKETSVLDSSHLPTFIVTNAYIRPARAGEDSRTEVSSWLPNASFAREWLAFIQQKSHAILPL